MTQTNEGASRDGDAGAPSKMSCLAADITQNSKPPSETQAQSCAAIEAAERGLLREQVYDACPDAINYLHAVMAFIAADDPPGLKYARHKFVTYANVVNNGCNELLGQPGGAR
jgi:hypothetical protein